MWPRETGRRLDRGVGGDLASKGLGFLYRSVLISLDSETGWLEAHEDRSGFQAWGTGL